jgi:hypothetical protein
MIYNYAMPVVKCVLSFELYSSDYVYVDGEQLGIKQKYTLF